MNYTERKAKEILMLAGSWIVNKNAEQFDKEVELKIKEIVRDVRHACAENVMGISVIDENSHACRGEIHNKVMNTELK